MEIILDWIAVSSFFLKNFEHILKSFFIFVFGFWIIKKTGKFVPVLIEKFGFDSSAATFLETIIKFILRCFLIVILLASFKVDVFSIITAISASLVTLALIFKENLSNFASGVLIIFEKTISLDDEIEIENYIGIVVKIGLTFSILKEVGGKNLIIPNAKLASCVIRRKSKFDIVLIEFKYQLKNLKNIKNIENTIERHILITKNKILTIPKILFECIEHNSESTEFIFKFWTYRADALEVRDTTNKFLNLTFKKNNVIILSKNTEIIL